jgi:hypothetical protein
MMTRISTIASIGIALALAVFAIGGSTTEGARRGTPTPTATSTPTPALPAHPSGVHVTDSILYWSDNSSDEEGFDIDLINCLSLPSQRSFHYQVPANSTSFPLPEEYKAAGRSCACPSQTWTVAAFNANGKASATGGTGLVDCAPSVTATPAVVVMPRTGAGGFGHSLLWQQAALLVGGVLALGGGLALFSLGKAQDRRRAS